MTSGWLLASLSFLIKKPGPRSWNETRRSLFLLGEEGEVDADDGEDDDDRPEQPFQNSYDDVESDCREQAGADRDDQLGEKLGGGVGALLPDEEQDGECKEYGPKHVEPPLVIANTGSVARIQRSD